MKIESYLLNLAGEYRVCSELNRRGVFATVTYGHRKSADVYAISDRRDVAVKVEVKTAQGGRFVTGISQKRLETDETAPDFWVLMNVRPTSDGAFMDRFFVLTHEKICKVQKDRNRTYARRCRRKHGADPDVRRGVDNVTVADVEDYENEWDKIAAFVEGR